MRQGSYKGWDSLTPYRGQKNPCLQDLVLACITTVEVVNQFTEKQVHGADKSIVPLRCIHKVNPLPLMSVVWGQSYTGLNAVGQGENSAENTEEYSKAHNSTKPKPVYSRIICATLKAISMPNFIFQCSIILSAGWVSKGTSLPSPSPPTPTHRHTHTLQKVSFSLSSLKTGWKFV